MVENLDTYDEIVKLLRGRKHAKLFGIKVEMCIRDRSWSCRECAE